MPGLKRTAQGQNGLPPVPPLPGLLPRGGEGAYCRNVGFADTVRRGEGQDQIRSTTVVQFNHKAKAQEIHRTHR